MKNTFSAKYSLTALGMSCSEAGVCSKGLQYCSDGAETMTESGMSCSTEDTGTQYCSRDAAEELAMPEYDFSVHYPVSLREEDCDWGEKREFYFQYFPEDPWDLQRNLISH